MKYTTNYNLKKPEYTDMADIPGDFNSNMDIIDTELKNANDRISTLENNVATLENDLQSSSYSTPAEEIAQVIHLPSNTVKGQISAVVDGRTLTNGFGNKGRFDDVTLLDGGVRATASTVADGIYGSNALEVTIDTGYTDGYGYVRLTDYVRTGKYYIALCNVKNIDGAKAEFSPNSGSGIAIVGYNITDTNYVLAYSIINPTHVDNIIANNGYLKFAVSGSEGQKARFDGARIYEITEEEYNKIYNGEYTSAEIADKYGYVDDTKSTLNTRLRSVGKNLIPQGYFSYSPISGGGTYTRTIIDSTKDEVELYFGGHLNYINFNQKILVKEGIMYALSLDYEKISGTGSGKLELRFYDETDTYLGLFSLSLGSDSSYIRKTIAQGSPANAYYCKIRIFAEDGDLTCRVKLPQLEQGDTATEYEPYKESTVYIDQTLRSLPNGVKDEVNVVDGKLIKRVSEEIFADDIEFTAYNNTQFNTINYVVTSNTWASSNNALYPQYNMISWNDEVVFKSVGLLVDDGTFQVAIADNGILYFAFPKEKVGGTTGYTDDLTGATQYLRDTNTTLIYQLAESIEHDLNITGLESFENGTLYIEPVIRKVYNYNSGITFEIPLESIERVRKVTSEGFEPVDLDNVTLASDGLSATITGASDGENYEVIGHIRSEETTIPTIQYSVPLNRAKQIDDNTEMINQHAVILQDHEMMILSNALDIIDLDQRITALEQP